MNDMEPDSSAIPTCFILGSCVSRDAFGPSANPLVADYVARMPFGAMFGKQPQTEIPEIELIPSKFQRRMVRNDWEKLVPARLAGSTYDYILVDLIDERFNLAEVGGSVISVSNELKLTGYDLDSARILRSGSPDHEQLFARGFDALIDQVGAEKVVVSRAYWASILTNGEPAGSENYIRASNAALDRLYSYIERYDVRWIEYSANELVGDSSHRWGASPFHFVDEFYESTRQALAMLQPGGPVA